MPLKVEINDGKTPAPSHKRRTLKDLRYRDYGRRRNHTQIDMNIVQRNTLGFEVLVMLYRSHKKCYCRGESESRAEFNYIVENRTLEFDMFQII